MKVKSIIFDFDGVICDSVDIKTDAFVEMYKEYGNEICYKVKNFHLQNGGISRFVKIKHFHENFLNTKINESELSFLANKFAEIVVQKVIKSKYIVGVIDFLEKNKSLSLFICTGTPTDEIKKILIKKNIFDLFTNVYGSPQTKVSIIQEIKTSYNLQSNELIYFGDALTDYEACVETNVNFIGIQNKDTKFPDHVKQIKNFLNFHI